MWIVGEKISCKSLSGKKIDAEIVSFKGGGIGEVVVVNLIDIKVGSTTLNSSKWINLNHFYSTRLIEDLII